MTFMASPRPAELLAQLPAELSHQLHFGHTLPHHLDPGEISHLASGLTPLDTLLGGGLRPGHCCEFSGALSGGRTSCALALLAGATRAGRGAAWVEVTEAFDPPSAQAAGVDLERLLWVRAPGLPPALRAAERLLDSRALALVVLDLTPPPRAAHSTAARARTAEAPSRASGLRLRRAAATNHTALLLLAETPQLGSFASTVLWAQAPRPRFGGAPEQSWFIGADAQLELQRDALRPREARAELALQLAPGPARPGEAQPSSPPPFASEVPSRARRVSAHSRPSRHRGVSGFS